MTDTDESSHPPSIAVVEAVAAERGVSPRELDERLADVIDPKALDALIASVDGRTPAPEFVVQFSFCDCLVAVSADGAVSVQ